MARNFPAQYKTYYQYRKAQLGGITPQRAAQERRESGISNPMMRYNSLLSDYARNNHTSKSAAKKAADFQDAMKILRRSETQWQRLYVESEKARGVDITLKEVKRDRNLQFLADQWKRDPGGELADALTAIGRRKSGMLFLVGDSPP